jgi:hypothetical protein
MSTGERLKANWPYVTAIFVAAAWVAHAEINHQDAKDTKELTKILAERHIADDAEKDGQRKAYKKMCAKGNQDACKALELMDEE